MVTNRATKRLLNMLLACTFLFTVAGLPAAQAGMVSTQMVVEQQQADERRAQLSALLERDDVREQLVRWGVDPIEAQARVLHLSDAEVVELAARMDEMPAGAGVLNALIFVFLVLLVTDILGFTDIFPFVRGPSR
jgi:hypothetical protein